MEASREELGPVSVQEHLHITEHGSHHGTLPRAACLSQSSVEEGWVPLLIEDHIICGSQSLGRNWRESLLATQHAGIHWYLETLPCPFHYTV